jgi:hypothetical protein
MQRVPFLHLDGSVRIAVVRADEPSEGLHYIHIDVVLLSQSDGLHTKLRPDEADIVSSPSLLNEEYECKRKRTCLGELIHCLSWSSSVICWDSSRFRGSCSARPVNRSGPTPIPVSLDRLERVWIMLLAGGYLIT